MTVFPDLCKFSQNLPTKVKKQTVKPVRKKDTSDRDAFKSNCYIEQKEANDPVPQNKYQTETLLYKRTPLEHNSYIGNPLNHDDLDKDRTKKVTEDVNSTIGFNKESIPLNETFDDKEDEQDKPCKERSGGSSIESLTETPLGIKQTTEIVGTLSKSVTNSTDEQGKVEWIYSNDVFYEIQKKESYDV